MPSFRVETPLRCYSAIVERGILGNVAECLPKHPGKVFVVSTEDVWRQQSQALARSLADVPHDVPAMILGIPAIMKPRKEILAIPSGQC
jgi:hypothetical protein